MYKSWWLRIDYLLLFLMLILIGIGLILISSATHYDEQIMDLPGKQLSFFFVGLVLMLIFAAVDYQLLAGFEVYFYILSIILLIMVIFFGHTALGAQRWLSIGAFRFQPSELTKIFVILSLAAHLSKEDALKPEKIAGTLIYIGVPMVLIILQPDLSTSLVLMAVFFLMLYIRGVNPFILLGTMVVGMASSPYILKDYQKQRLLVFLNPEADPTGTGWNIIQSIVGIGSGRLWGKGLFSGTQTQLKFVPEHSTDFIFTVLGEELGFAGCVSLILIYFFLLWRTLKIGHQSKDLLGTLIAVGIGAMFFFQIFVNIGMAVGIMPVTGLPLPFISYGGSSLIANMIAIGLLLNITYRRELFFKTKK